MSYMTTTMFAPRIWGFDFSHPQAQVALAAGWRRADILWEDLMVAGNAAWLKGEKSLASMCFRRASWVARLCFDARDLRRATVLVNRGIVAREAGKTVRAAAFFAKAVSIWDSASGQAVADMQIAPRSRSSLFHLRMEALHRDTYHDNFRKRISMIASEVRAAVENYQQDQLPECRLYSRWIGERPTVYDDTRKVIGACLLIVDSPPPDSIKRPSSKRLNS